MLVSNNDRITIATTFFGGERLAYYYAQRGKHSIRTPGRNKLPQIASTYEL